MIENNIFYIISLSYMEQNIKNINLIYKRDIINLIIKLENPLPSLTTIRKYYYKDSPVLSSLPIITIEDNIKMIAIKINKNGGDNNKYSFSINVPSNILIRKQYLAFIGEYLIKIENKIKILYWYITIPSQSGKLPTILKLVTIDKEHNRKDNYQLLKRGIYLSQTYTNNVFYDLIYTGEIRLKLLTNNLFIPEIPIFFYKRERCLYDKSKTRMIIEKEKNK